MEINIVQLTEDVRMPSNNDDSPRKLYFDSSKGQLISINDGEPVPVSASPLDRTISQHHID